MPNVPTFLDVTTCYVNEDKIVEVRYLAITLDLNVAERLPQGTALLPLLLLFNNDPAQDLTNLCPIFSGDVKAEGVCTFRGLGPVRRWSAQYDLLLVLDGYQLLTTNIE